MARAKHDVIVYRGTSVPAMDVMVDGETVWLSIDQMAVLFGRDPSVIGKHVRNVFSEEELDILPNRQNLPICGKVHPVSYYSLDAVEHRLTQVENGLEVIAQQLSEDPEPFLSKDRKMIGFNVG